MNLDLEMIISLFQLITHSIFRKQLLKKKTLDSSISRFQQKKPQVDFRSK